MEGGTAIGLHGSSTDPEDDMELPSYTAHVRDRVANAFLPETGVMRVTNPWVAQGVSPVMANPTSETPSGSQSPVAMEAHLISAGSRNQLPPVPPPPGSQQQPLEWVNSELLLSMSRMDAQDTPPDSAARSPRESRFQSRRGSRPNSRPSSPEHAVEHAGATGDGGHGQHGQPNETYVHGSSSASRHLHELFHISMKPFSGLTNGFNLGNRSQSQSNLQDRFPHGHSHLSTTTNVLNPTNEARTRASSGSNSPLSSGMVSPTASSLHITPINVTARPTSQEPTCNQLLLHRAFTETPDYEIASRGFLGGGVPPLDSFRDLPSYEDAAAEGRAEVLRGRIENEVVRHDTSSSTSSNPSSSSSCGSQSQGAVSLTTPDS